MYYIYRDSAQKDLSKSIQRTFTSFYSIFGFVKVKQIACMYALIIAICT